MNLFAFVISGLKIRKLTECDSRNGAVVITLYLCDNLKGMGQLRDRKKSNANFADKAAASRAYKNCFGGSVIPKPTPV